MVLNAQPQTEPTSPHSHKGLSPARLIWSLIPLILFYLLDEFVSLEAGLAAAIAFALFDLAIQYRQRKRFDTLTVLSTVLVVVLGGTSLLSSDERFMLYTPVAGDLLFALFLIQSIFRKKPLLVEVAIEQGILSERQGVRANYMKTLTLHLALNLLLHGAVTAWSTTQSKEVWLFVSGPLQYIFFGIQFLVDFLYGRLIVSNRLDKEEDSLKNASTSESSHSEP